MRKKDSANDHIKFLWNDSVILILTRKSLFPGSEKSAV